MAAEPHKGRPVAVAVGTQLAAPRVVAALRAVVACHMAMGTPAVGSPADSQRVVGIPVGSLADKPSHTGTDIRVVHIRAVACRILEEASRMEEEASHTVVRCQARRRHRHPPSRGHPVVRPTAAAHKPTVVAADPAYRAAEAR